MLTLANVMGKKNPSYSGDYGATTHTGSVRKVNEDTFSAKPEIGLWLIADGMGGHSSGAIASSITRDTIDERIAYGEGLSEAIRAAHNDVVKKAQKNKDFDGMGCTVVAVLLDGVEYEVAWVGDSRAYLWDGRLTQITQDHSYVRSLVSGGAITQEEAETHPARHLITRCLGIDDQDGPFEVEVRRGRFSRGQELLLCSDGLTDELTDSEIEEVIAVNASAQDRVDSLIESALDHGGNDNVTVIVLCAPENAPEPTARSETTGLGTKIELVLVGALLAAFLLGLIFYLR